MPHPHLKTTEAAAKRMKILVITVVVSVGLVVLVSVAILRGGKDEDDDKRIIEPAKLRACVIAAAVEGRRGLSRGKGQALNIAFSAYAKERGIHWKDQVLDHSESVTRNIGNDSVTIIIPGDGSELEVQSICGNMEASAAANGADGSVSSSVFTSRGLEREPDIE